MAGESMMAEEEGKITARLCQASVGAACCLLTKGHKQTGAMCLLSLHGF